MPRVVKAPEDRRNEILDCAQALFFERGYDATTVNDVIARSGISKGGFYHHFRSKEELLEALATRVAHEALARVQDVLDDPHLDALARLNAFLARSRRMKVEDAPRLMAVFKVVFRPENIVLYHRLNAATAHVMLPMLVRILAQGAREGAFDVPDPQAMAEIILHLAASTHDAVARAIRAAKTPEGPAAVEALQERLRLHGVAVDRILGLPDGSLDFIEPGFARAVLLVD